jgi:heme exporter protein A
MALFEARQLACQRGERLLFQSLDFQLAAGQAILLTGTNGSGKSSLLRLAAGLSRPIDGAFLWDGRPIAQEPDQHRRRVLYLGHADAVKGGLSVRENLRFWADLAGLPKAGRSTGNVAAVIDAAIDQFDLAPLMDLPARFLSAGQRRRLALSRLMLQPAARQPLWLLDEPTNALDNAAQQRLLDLLLRHLADGGLILLASHEALGALPGQRLGVDAFQPRLSAVTEDFPLSEGGRASGYGEVA